MGSLADLHNSYAYGLWGPVALNVIFALMFVVGFLAPRRKREWRSMGMLTAFLVALFTEMFGFPLTVYMLASLLGNRYPAANPLSHENGHLWGAFLGSSQIFCNLGTVFIITGAVIIGLGWAKIHRSRGKLVTTGVYRLVRHPQYLGLLLAIIGALLQWPTLVTMIMAPVLGVAYVWLARREEHDMETAFGEDYRSYKEKTPAFFPRLPRKKPAMAQEYPGTRYTTP